MLRLINNSFSQIEGLLVDIGEQVSELLELAETMEKGGRNSKRRLLIPGLRNLWKLATDALQPESSYELENPGVVDIHSDPFTFGAISNFRRDPDHLPPKNYLQRIGDKIRILPQWLGSHESAFGFRVACATMTVAIIALLEETQQFFIRQRLVWAVIVINLSMSPTVGQSISNFLLRLAGTAAAIASTIVIWYMARKTTAGVIFTLFLFYCGCFYAQIEVPSMRLIALICNLTTTLIIGYELQIRKIGEEAATSNGQPYYPIYVLAPYRLATISVGISVAFFWTMFPYPVSEHSLLRRGLGTMLYLMATYHSLVRQMISSRTPSQGFNHDIPSLSLNPNLGKAQNRHHSNQLLVLKDLHAMSSFLKWELSIGGKLPLRQYKALMFYTEEYANVCYHI